jgi:hypothetical protein
MFSILLSEAAEEAERVTEPSVLAVLADLERQQGFLCQQQLIL